MVNINPKASISSAVKNTGGNTNTGANKSTGSGSSLKDFTSRSKQISKGGQLARDMTNFVSANKPTSKVGGVGKVYTSNTPSLRMGQFDSQLSDFLNSDSYSVMGLKDYRLTANRYASSAKTEDERQYWVNWANDIDGYAYNTINDQMTQLTRMMERYDQSIQNVQNEMKSTASVYSGDYDTAARKNETIQSRLDELLKAKETATAERDALEDELMGYFMTREVWEARERLKENNYAADRLHIGGIFNGILGKGTNQHDEDQALVDDFMHNLGLQAQYFNTSDRLLAKTKAFGERTLAAGAEAFASGGRMAAEMKGDGPDTSFAIDRRDLPTYKEPTKMPQIASIEEGQQRIALAQAEIDKLNQQNADLERSTSDDIGYQLAANNKRLKELNKIVKEYSGQVQAIQDQQSIEAGEKPSWSYYLRSGSEDYTLSKIEEFADKHAVKGQLLSQKATADTSPAGKFALDAYEAVLGIAFDGATAALTGGSSLATMFARVYGEEAGNARRLMAENGGIGDRDVLGIKITDRDRQRLYAGAKASIEVITEKMTDGLNLVYGKGITSDIVEDAIQRVAKTDLGADFLRLLAGAGGEGMEELVSGLMDPIAQWLIDEDARGHYASLLDPKELAYETVMGLALGLVGSSAEFAQQRTLTNAGSEASKNIQYTNKLNEKYDQIMERLGEDATSSITGKEQRMINHLTERTETRNARNQGRGKTESVGKPGTAPKERNQNNKFAKNVEGYNVRATESNAAAFANEELAKRDEESAAEAEANLMKALAEADEQTTETKAEEAPEALTEPEKNEQPKTPLQEAQEENKRLKDEFERRNLEKENQRIRDQLAKMDAEEGKTPPPQGKKQRTKTKPVEANPEPQQNLSNAPKIQQAPERPTVAPQTQVEAGDISVPPEAAETVKPTPTPAPARPVGQGATSTAKANDLAAQQARNAPLQATQEKPAVTTADIVEKANIGAGALTELYESNQDGFAEAYEELTGQPFEGYNDLNDLANRALQGEFDNSAPESMPPVTEATEPVTAEPVTEPVTEPVSTAKTEETPGTVETEAGGTPSVDWGESAKNGDINFGDLQNLLGSKRAPNVDAIEALHEILGGRVFTTKEAAIKRYLEYKQANFPDKMTSMERAAYETKVVRKKASVDKSNAKQNNSKEGVEYDETGDTGSPEGVGGLSDNQSGTGGYLHTSNESVQNRDTSAKDGRKNLVPKERYQYEDLISALKEAKNWAKEKIAKVAKRLDAKVDDYAKDGIYLIDERKAPKGWKPILDLLYDNGYRIVSMFDGRESVSHTMGSASKGIDRFGLAFITNRNRSGPAEYHPDGEVAKHEITHGFCNIYEDEINPIDYEEITDEAIRRFIKAYEKAEPGNGLTFDVVKEYIDSFQLNTEVIKELVRIYKGGYKQKYRDFLLDSNGNARTYTAKKNWVEKNLPGKLKTLQDDGNREKVAEFASNSTNYAYGVFGKGIEGGHPEATKYLEAAMQEVLEERGYVPKGFYAKLNPLADALSTDDLARFEKVETAQNLAREYILNNNAEALAELKTFVKENKIPFKEAKDGLTVNGLFFDFGTKPTISSQSLSSYKPRQATTVTTAKTEPAPVVKQEAPETETKTDTLQPKTTLQKELVSRLMHPKATGEKILKFLDKDGAFVANYVKHQNQVNKEVIEAEKHNNAESPTELNKDSGYDAIWSAFKELVGIDADPTPQVVQAVIDHYRDGKIFESVSAEPTPGSQIPRSTTTGKGVAKNRTSVNTLKETTHGERVLIGNVEYESTSNAVVQYCAEDNMNKFSYQHEYDYFKSLDKDHLNREEQEEARMMTRALTRELWERFRFGRRYVNQKFKGLDRKGLKEGIKFFRNYETESRGKAGSILQQTARRSVSDTIYDQARQQLVGNIENYDRVNTKDDNVKLFFTIADGLKYTDHLIEQHQAKPSADDNQKMVEHIKDYSYIRGVSRTFGPMGSVMEHIESKLLDRIAKSGDGAFDMLSMMAYGNINNILSDFNSSKAAQVAQQIRYLNMLSNFATAVSNIGNNASVIGIDSTAQNVGRLLTARQFANMLEGGGLEWDYTGKRAAFWTDDAEYMRQQRFLAMAESVLSLYYGLDVDDGKLDTKLGKKSYQNDNALGKLLGTANFISMLKMQTTDAMAKARTRAGMELGINKNANLTQEQRETKLREAKNTAEYRLFHNESKATRAVAGIRKALDSIQIGKHIAGGKYGSIGVGTLLMPFVKVPTNVAMMAVKASPLGSVYGFAKYIQGSIALQARAEAARKGATDSNGDPIKAPTYNEVAELQRTLGRSVTNAGIAVIGAALAMLGGIRDFDNEDDDDMKRLAKEHGWTGTQINIQAALRPGHKWEDGDKVIGGGWLDILGVPLVAGYQIYKETLKEDAGFAKAVLKSPGNSLLNVLDTASEIPGIKQISELFNEWDNLQNYDTLEEGISKEWATAMQYGANTFASFVIPNAVAQFAAGYDNTVRDVYHADSNWEIAKNIVKNKIPGLRETLPEAKNTFGETRSYGENRIMGMVNRMILPGTGVQVYQRSALEKLYDRLSQEGYRNVAAKQSAPKYVTVNGDDYDLNTEAQRAYDDQYSTRVAELHNTANRSDDFNQLDGMGQQYVLRALRSEAKREAEQSALDGMNVNEQIDFDRWEEALRDDPQAQVRYLCAKWEAKQLYDGGEITDFNQMDEYLSGTYSKLTDAERELLSTTYTRLDNMYEGLSRAGVSSKDYTAAYNLYKEYTDSDNPKYNKYTKPQIARYLDEAIGNLPGLNKKQVDWLNDDLVVYQNMPASTEAYDALETAGLSKNTANRWLDQSASLKPREDLGYSGVSRNQKYIAIKEGNYTENEKWLLFQNVATTSAWDKVNAYRNSHPGCTYEEAIHNAYTGTKKKPHFDELYPN